MGTSEEPRRSRIALLSLLGVVVVVGAVSLATTLGIGHNVRPPTTSPSPGPTPVPLDCSSNQLELVGAFNECVSIDHASSACEASPPASAAPPPMPAWNTQFTLLGPSDDFLLYLNVPNGYSGAGEYRLDTGAAEVDVRENTTGAFWHSVAGLLTITDNAGRSGTVSAVLASAANHGGVAGATLTLDGSWSCSATAIPTSIPATPTPLSVDLSGSWGGLCTGPFNGPCSLTLTQTGNALNGTFTVITGQSLHISGNVTGSTISFRAVGVATFTGTLSGATMSGSYTDIASGKTGSWSVTL